MSEAKIKRCSGPTGGWRTPRLHCPGCAWPESSKASKFCFCENGVNAFADVLRAQNEAPRCKPPAASGLSHTERDLLALERTPQ